MQPFGCFATCLKKAFLLSKLILEEKSSFSKPPNGGLKRLKASVFCGINDRKSIDNPSKPPFEKGGFVASLLGWCKWC